MSHKHCDNNYGNNFGIGECGGFDGFGGCGGSGGSSSIIIIIIVITILFCGNRGNNFGKGC